jgi:hypothetical protein
MVSGGQLMKARRIAAHAGAHAENLEQVEQRFVRWRASRKRGERIPQALWCAAVALAREHGLAQIAQELRVDCDGLKRRLDSAEFAARAGGSAAKFVELIAPSAVGICECIVELENARGAKLRIELKGVELGQLARLSSVFLNAVG